MASPIIKTSFAAGELAPSLQGRVDLAKYQVGAAVMRNFFVDPRGGASTRPGTRHVGRPRLIDGNPPPRLIPFIFSSDQTYVLELNGTRMRVINDGEYVTEVAHAITGMSGVDGTLTAVVPGHGLQPGDHVVVRGVTGITRANGISAVNGRVFSVGQVSGDRLFFADFTSELGYSLEPDTGLTEYFQGGEVAKIHEVGTPWQPEDLFNLKYVQSADVMTVTYLDYPPYDIKRYGHADWRVEGLALGTDLPPPANVTATALNTGDAATQVFFFAYVVTSVDENGRESLVSAVASCTNKALDQSLTPTRVNQIEWDAVPGSNKYRIYKAQPIPDGLQTGGTFTYGVVGNVFDTQFVDVNYSPDYTQGPPIARNPFANTGIASAALLTPGEGYIAPRAVVTDPNGTGAVLALVSDTTATAAPYGGIISTEVLDPGTGYTNPTITVVDDAPLGSGAELGFTGEWVANPLGSGYVPAPGSIYVKRTGTNYHRRSYAAFMKAKASANAVGTNEMFIAVDKVENGGIASVLWGPDRIATSPELGLSTVPDGALTFTQVGTDGGGAGAQLVATLGGWSNPNTCSYLQQRRVFGGSRANPSTLWLSRPGQFGNFDVSDPVQDSDAITAALNAQEVNIIAALIAAPGGLLALTSGGAYLVSGEGGVTPGTIQANPQAFTGCQPDLQPLRVGNQLIYAQARGSVVAELAYNFYSSTFASQDISVLSSHLLEGHKIIQWVYAGEPHHIIWAVRDDGILLSLTYLKEQEVYGWARHDTNGYVVSIATVPEGREDAVYLIVKRLTGIGYMYAVERMQLRYSSGDAARNFVADTESAWCVDGGAAYEPQPQQTTLEMWQGLVRGKLHNAVVGYGGTGYTSPLIEVYDDTGYGGSVQAVVSGGVIVGLTILTEGEKYSNPRLVVRDPTGGGAMLNVGIVDTIGLEAGQLLASADVGKVLRVAGGKLRIMSISGARMTCEVIRLPAAMNNAVGYRIMRARPGQWSMMREVTVVGGLDHLNGSTVQILADGTVQTPQVVVNGCVKLDSPASYVIVGQGFSAQLQTMPLEPPGGTGTLQGRRKTIPHVVLRTKDTRGLYVGKAWDELTEVAQRDLEPMGQAIGVQEGGQPMPDLFDGAPVSMVPLFNPDTHTNLPTGWDELGVVCVQQSYPLPATVLAVVPFIAAGDTAQ